MRNFLKSIAIAGGLLAGVLSMSGAQAGTATGTVGVTGTFVASCSLPATTIALGTIDLQSYVQLGKHVRYPTTLAVTCNGPTKGGAPETIATLKKVASLQAMYQLHRNIKLADNEQAPAENIANQEDTPACKGNWIKASVAKDGGSYTVQVGAEGKPREFKTR